MKSIRSILALGFGAGILLASVSCGQTYVITPEKKVPVYQTRYVQTPAPRPPSGPPTTIPGDARAVGGTGSAAGFPAVSE